MTLLWVYYSSVIFLLGAEFTRAYSARHGSRPDLMVDQPMSRKTRAAPKVTRPDRSSALAMALLFLTWASAALIPMKARTSNRVRLMPARGPHSFDLAEFQKRLRKWM